MRLKQAQFQHHAVPAQLAQKKAAWRVGAYVRVHGNMRTFDSRRTIVAFNIRAILDFNEVAALLFAAVI